MFRAIVDAVKKFVAPKSSVRVDPAYFQPKPKASGGAPKGSRDYYRGRATRICAITHRDPMYLHRSALELQAWQQRQSRRRFRREQQESAPVGASA